MDQAPEANSTDNTKGPSSRSKTDAKAAALAKYNLRTKSIQNRIEVERRKNAPRHPKPKQKPAPLSKYRRKTANFRERVRMQEMNDAFKRLQNAVPEVFAETAEDMSSGASTSSLSSAAVCKATKINTLKLAVNYISALTAILNSTNEDSPATPQFSALPANNENRPSTSHHPLCQSITGPSACTGEHSRHKDLNIGANCQRAAFDHFASSSSAHLAASSQIKSAPAPPKMIYPHTPASGSCAISSPFYGYGSAGSSTHLPATTAQQYCGHMALDTSIWQMRNKPVSHGLFASATPDTIEPSHQAAPFDLNDFTSLVPDSQALLDDFSAIIDDLQEDSFSLVDGLID